ncbi:hypothetical protein MCEGE14_02074 [Burkholderiaceae bacterium]
MNLHAYKMQAQIDIWLAFALELVAFRSQYKLQKQLSCLREIRASKFT